MASIRKRQKPKNVRILQPGPVLVDCMKFTVLNGFVVNISRLNEECKGLKEKMKNRRNDDDEVITIEDDDDVILIEDDVIRIESDDMTDIVDVEDDTIKVSDDETELIITDIRTVKDGEFSSDEVVSSKQNKVEENKTVFKHKKLDLRRVEVMKEGEENEVKSLNETGITVNIFI